MLVFRPKKVVGSHRGFDIILASTEATQDSKKFDQACEELERILDETKDRRRP